jgi:hypothetical protein
MAEARPITFMIRRNAWHWNFHGWVIFERQRERKFSKMTYVRQREAEDAAKVRMFELTAGWRSGRR